MFSFYYRMVIFLRFFIILTVDAIQVQTEKVNIPSAFDYYALT